MSALAAPLRLLREPANPEVFFSDRKKTWQSVPTIAENRIHNLVPYNATVSIVYANGSTSKTIAIGNNKFSMDGQLLCQKPSADSTLELTWFYDAKAKFWCKGWEFTAKEKKQDDQGCYENFNRTDMPRNLTVIPKNKTEAPFIATFADQLFCRKPCDAARELSLLA